jgi:hypothetical protein
MNLKRDFVCMDGSICLSSYAAQQTIKRVRTARPKMPMMNKKLDILHRQLVMSINFTLV